MNTKSILIATSVGMLLLSSLSYAAVRGNMGPMRGDDTVQSAVEANNYSALSDSAKSRITEARFNDMVAKKSGQDAVQNAVKAGDYTAFRAAMIAQIPSESEFQDMVARYQAREKAHTAVETAVKTNDFNAFKTAMEAQKSEMAEWGNSGKVEERDGRMGSDAQLQKHFNMLVAYFKANGELPDMGEGFGPAGKGMGLGGGKEGMHDIR